MIDTFTAVALLVAVEAVPPPRCVDEVTRDAVLALTLKGIDEAFKAQINHLFEVWMKDPAEQPRRARVGFNQALDAYLRATAQAKSWNPPVCN